MKLDIDLLIKETERLQECNLTTSIIILNKLCYLNSIFKFTFIYRHFEKIKLILKGYTSEEFQIELKNTDEKVRFQLLQNIFYLTTRNRNNASIMEEIEELVFLIRKNGLLNNYTGIFEIYESAKSLSNQNSDTNVQKMAGYYKTYTMLKEFNYEMDDLSSNSTLNEKILFLLKLTGFNMDFIQNDQNGDICKINNFIMIEKHFEPLFQLLKSILNDENILLIGPPNSGKSELLKNLACGYFLTTDYPSVINVSLGSHIDSNVNIICILSI